jgi:hypothetical protein
MKEFFLSLGSCFFASGSYNGFFLQKFGRERLPKTCSKGVTAASANAQRHSNHSKPREDGRGYPATLLNEARSETGKGPAVHIFSVTHDQDTFDRFEARQNNVPSVPFFSQSPIKSRFQDLNPASNGAQRPSISGNQSMITFLAHDGSEGRCAVRGQSRRKGALDAETLRKAREVRKLGACWNCWVMKIPVSLLTVDLTVFSDRKIFSVRKERPAIVAARKLVFQYIDCAIGILSQHTQNSSFLVRPLRNHLRTALLNPI